MELQIQDLVTSIRKEGIDAANEQGAQIIADAKKQAEAIIAEAKAEAKAAHDSSAREISILKEGAIASAEQAKRDALLSFKAAIKEDYEKILSAKVSENMSGAALGKLIQAVAVGEDISGYTAEVAEVSEELTKTLAEEIRNGLEIKPVKGVSAGFRLASKDGSGYFDCSDDEIMQMLKPYFRNMDF